MCKYTVLNVLFFVVVINNAYVFYTKQRGELPFTNIFLWNMSCKIQDANIPTVGTNTRREEGEGLFTSPSSGQEFLPRGT